MPVALQLELAGGKNAGLWRVVGIGSLINRPVRSWTHGLPPHCNVAQLFDADRGMCEQRGLDDAALGCETLMDFRMGRAWR